MLIDLEKTHKISRIHLIRELLELEILASLTQQPWSNRIAFYGGTALRLAYGSGRFSEDIDLIMLRRFPFSAFKKWVTELPKILSQKTTVEDLYLKRNTFFALLLLSHPEMKHALPIKIELFRKKKGVVVNTELRLLVSPLSSLSPLIRVPTLLSLLEMKTAALAEREKPRDLYDLWYVSQLLKKPLVLPKTLPHFQKRAFVNELQVYLPKNLYPVISTLWSLYESAA
jgi:predicted nucleotidyltransferase component of viral defense system